MNNIIISFLITKFILNITFYQLNKFYPNLFSPLKKLTEKWRGKSYYRWIVSFVLILISSVLSSFLNLSYIAGGIFIAFILSLNDIAWGPLKWKIEWEILIYE